MDEQRLLLEWDEWDGRIGLRKNYVKKLMIMTSPDDAKQFENKITKDFKVYTINQLKEEVDETGNVVLAGGGLIFKTERIDNGGEDKELRENVKETAVQHRKRRNIRKTN